MAENFLISSIRRGSDSFIAITCSSSRADRFLMFCVRGSSCGSVRANRSADVTMREICVSVSDGLSETTFEEADEEEEIVGGVPNVDEAKLQKP